MAWPCPLGLPLQWVVKGLGASTVVLGILASVVLRDTVANYFGGVIVMWAGWFSPKEVVRVLLSGTAWGPLSPRSSSCLLTVYLCTRTHSPHPRCLVWPFVPFSAQPDCLIIVYLYDI